MRRDLFLLQISRSWTHSTLTDTLNQRLLSTILALWILLLLLAGFLSTTLLLLAGFLARALVLLARVLVLIAHFRISLLNVAAANPGTSTDVA